RGPDALALGGVDTGTPWPGPTRRRWAPRPGSHLGADPLPEPLPGPATPTEPTHLTCGNAIEAGSLTNRTSFGTKRSWVQIPPPRQRNTRPGPVLRDQRRAWPALWPRFGSRWGAHFLKPAPGERPSAVRPASIAVLHARLSDIASELPLTALQLEESPSILLQSCRERTGFTCVSARGDPVPAVSPLGGRHGLDRPGQGAGQSVGGQEPARDPRGTCRRAEGRVRPGRRTPSGGVRRQDGRRPRGPEVRALGPGARRPRRRLQVALTASVGTAA